jgi:hypothetical protein
VGKEAGKGDILLVQSEMRGNPARDVRPDFLEKPCLEHAGLFSGIALVQGLQGVFHDDPALLDDRLAEFAVYIDFLPQDVHETVKESPQGPFDGWFRRDVHILTQHGIPFVVDCLLISVIILRQAQNDMVITSNHDILLLITDVDRRDCCGL